MDIRKLKTRARATKNHIRYHRAKYTAGVLTTLFVMILLRSAKEQNEFLRSKGIDPLEFCCPEWYDEIKNS